MTDEKQVNVGINGFGRIGRCYLRLAQKDPRINVVAVNDLWDARTLAYLFKHDSVQGVYDGEVSHDGNDMIIDGKRIPVTRFKSPADIHWVNVDVVLESTGLFKRYDSASGHLNSEAKSILISSPREETDKNIQTIVMGINEGSIDIDNHKIFSNASCTTNCLAQVFDQLDSNYKVFYSIYLTVHAPTNDQALVDQPHKDLRRGRSAIDSIIPTSSGAEIALNQIMEGLEGRTKGMALRVNSIGSLVLLYAVLGKSPSCEEVNSRFLEASDSRPGIIGYCKDPIVSIDCRGDTRSAIFDPSLTMRNGQLFQVGAWYDNEMNYSGRLIDLTKHIGDRLR